MNRLTDIFAVGKFDYGVMVRYQNLTRKPELFRAPLGPGPGTMYPLNPPLAGPECIHLIAIVYCCYWQFDGTVLLVVHLPPFPRSFGVLYTKFIRSLI